ncbi:MAG TPA: PPK2 family polyphosphate kinase [Opitutaceae bacterium]|jgi:PPK2 family polyphosphate:nucleotide phosphotransferase|nr:PPK2 family polyphosphate kinase [Opitutaceae bacterium]
MRIRIDPADFRLRPGARPRLRSRPTLIEPCYRSKEDYRQRLKTRIAELAELQARLQAEARSSLLLVLQGQDASGKDSAIKHVLSGLNPQSCRVASFKPPTRDELQHDFLWRAVYALPKRGQIGIFNRSHYEEVLVVRVHPEILKAERLPVSSLRNLWSGRFRSIVEWERHLVRNGTRIVKVFLHISKDLQRRRFLRRIENPAKNWKMDPADLRERRWWDAYERAYEDCLAATGIREAPWHIVPADDKHTVRLILAQILLEELRGLRLRPPRPDRAQRRELQAVRRKLSRAA